MPLAALKTCGVLGSSQDVNRRSRPAACSLPRQHQQVGALCGELRKPTSITVLLQGADQESSIGQELTNQLKTPLYKQLIGNTPMVDLSSLSANPQVSSQASLAS